MNERISKQAATPGQLDQIAALSNCTKAKHDPAPNATENRGENRERATWTPTSIVVTSTGYRPIHATGR